MSDVANEQDAPHPLVLLVEDDPAIRNLLAAALEASGYRFIGAATGADAVREAALRGPDLLMLDLGLPDADGVDIIKKIRSWSSMPIIVVSARSEDADKVEALDAGADDYLTKPFSMDEVLARLRASLRRVSMGVPGDEGSVFVNGDLRIDFAAGCASMAGQELHLTPIEYRLLTLLARNVGKVLTRAYITQQIWGTSWDSDVASLRVFMATLRKKIEPDPANPRYIQTHIGVGYRMQRVDLEQGTGAVFHF